MIRGERCLLRPHREQDVVALEPLRNDLDLQLQLLALPRPNATPRVLEWMNRVASDSAAVFFVIAEPATDVAIGFLQIARIDTVSRRGELGIALVASSRGKGVGAEAILLAENYASDVFGLRKITLSVIASNAQAVAAYKKLGYREVGVLREHAYQRGAFHDVLVMEHFIASEGGEGRA